MKPWQDASPTAGARDGTARAFAGRLVLATWGTSVIMLVLIGRLYSLQVLRGDEMQDKGRRNFVNQVQIRHDRGIIFDRRGRILADNRPSLDVVVTPAFLGKRLEIYKTVEQLTSLLNLNDEDALRITQAIEARMGLERFRPLTIKRDISEQQVDAIEAGRALFLLDGVDIVEGRRRIYHYGTLAAHVLGYVGEIDAQGLDNERARGNPEHYDLGDLIGRDGLERVLEPQLRGQDGVEKVVVDAKGRRQHAALMTELLGHTRQISPRPGHNVFLTLDLDLQATAEAQLLERGRAGSVVALDVRTGAVLALASVPGFNSNVISTAFTREEKERLDTDPLKPWINRSIAGQYAPGSTFKVITALAARAHNAVGFNETITCPGHFKLGRHTWRCWRDMGHGPFNLYQATKNSCDVFFYTLGARLGIAPIAMMARSLGLGARTQIALRGEQSGLVPDEAFHNRIEASLGGYQRGMAVNTSIGQGALLVTPLQMAVAYAAVANGGSVFVPQLVDHTESADLRLTRRTLVPHADYDVRLPEHRATQVRVETEGQAPEIIEGFVARRLRQLALGSDAFVEVQRGLRGVVEEPGGTAFAHRSKKTTMAGKTGTAQVVRLGRERLKGWQTDYFERDHAWFVAYAPAEQPRIVVAVLNEHAGHGGPAAAPIARAVIDRFIDLEEASR